MTRQTKRAPDPHMHVAIDAHRIWTGLFQGSIPPEGEALRHLGVDALVLTAIEHQPPASRFPGVHVIHAPMDDDGEPMDEDTWSQATSASLEVADLIRRDKLVLVTCYQGLNRSGLVSALTLLRLMPRHRMSSEEAICLVQARRPRALFNPYFVEAILRVR